MKKKRMTRFLLLCTLCFLTVGCSSTKNGSASTESGQAEAASSMESADHSGGDSKTAVVSSEQGEPGTGVVVAGEDFAPTAGKTIPVSGSGKKDISYTGEGDSVAYVTSAEELPDYEELAQYDDDFFKEHALVLVTKTMNSSSAEVGILSISTKGTVAEVMLYHEEGEGSADDMATWLLWAEVESGLEYRWTVKTMG